MAAEMDDLSLHRQNNFDFATYCVCRQLIEEMVARGTWTNTDIKTVASYIITTTPVTSMSLWATLQQSNVKLLMACHPYVSTLMVEVGRAVKKFGTDDLSEDEYKKKWSGPLNRIYEKYLQNRTFRLALDRK